MIMMTRVLIVDDVAQVRYDLGTALALSGELEIIGEAAHGLQAVRLTERLLILTDFVVMV